MINNINLSSLQGEEQRSIGGPVDVRRTNGGRLLSSAKQVPPESVDGKILFASPDGKFFSAKGRQLKHCFNPATQRRSPCHHGGYPRMANFSNRLCHHLIYETFIGPRTPGMEIDHINGDKLDYSADNLQEVTPRENIRRAKILRQLRAMGINPKLLTREQLLDIFQKPLTTNP